MDERIDTENTLIHPLLIQPFVENAIWHGIKPKDSKGHISIKISRKENILTASVEDNGIGRENSRKTRKKNKQHKASVGIQLTEERIKIINQRTKEKDNIQFFDLEQGLKVDIKTPYTEAF